ncbi:hypothetical protein BDV33DRAFT_184583 [Aspergillus novoparasiticus]|uniref:Uncharacterized protein n=1 Tax=Aspergillus novoparasiticus TaxID=986946 RepID=A0A5N6E9R2_9EURO|nr:hypothetical protein BDV33DRAFT_184583 [Aspergillus novoparasiticus]
MICSSLLRNAGYRSRLSAKAKFNAKAKLLYNFAYKSDRVRAVRALLVMSYWQDKQDTLQNRATGSSLRLSWLAAKGCIESHPRICMSKESVCVGGWSGPVFCATGILL